MMLKGKTNSRSGFTLVELLIVLGIMAIISTFVFLNIRTLGVAKSVESATEQSLALLKNAQNRSLASEQNALWGVYLDRFTPNQHFLALYKGTNCAQSSPCSSSNYTERVTLSSSISIDTFAIAGCANAGSYCTISFKKNGTTDNYGTLIDSGAFELTQETQRRQVRVAQLGTLQQGIPIPIQYALTVSNSPSAGGTITSVPAGINCGATCGVSFDSGTSITLTASQSASYTFSGWTGSGDRGACSGGSVNPCTFTITQPVNLVASYTTPYTLTITKAGTGTGTVTSNIAGINCGATCSAQYNSGTSVTLTAAADPSKVFAGWSVSDGTSCPGTGTCTVVMNANKTVTATFNIQPAGTINVQSSPVAGIAMNSTSDSGGPTCPGTTNYTCSPGDNVSVNITPGSSTVFIGGTTYTFSSWTGCNSTNANTCIVSVAAGVSKTVTANYTITAHQLTVANATANGSISSSPAGINCGATCSASYNVGTNVVLTVTPNSGYGFSGWTLNAGSAGGCTASVNPCTVTMNGNVSLTASYVVLRTLTLTKSGTGDVTSPQGGISCLSGCTSQSASYPNGTSVTLSASPSTGVFSGGCTGTGSCTVVMNANKSVTATFGATYTLTVVVNGCSGGNCVVQSPGPAYKISCPGVCSATFSENEVVTLSAYTQNSTAANSFTLVGWSVSPGGGCVSSGSGQPSYLCSVTMSASKTATVTFTAGHRLNVTICNHTTGGSNCTTNTVNNVTSSPAGINCTVANCSAIFTGASVTLSTTGAGGYSFWNWSGCSGSAPTITFQLSDESCTANFKNY